MIYKGKVISTHLQDPTNLVRVAVPQVSGTKTQTARVGISDVIEPGDQVWVGYEAGDFSAPVVLGKVGEPPEGPEGPAGPEGLPASRNLLHNGAMQVHQRSTSVAGITTANWHTADRWYLLHLRWVHGRTLLSQMPPREADSVNRTKSCVPPQMQVQPQVITSLSVSGLKAKMYKR